MKYHILLVFSCCVLTAPSFSQGVVTGTPDSATIITSDINHFWKAFGKLQQQHSTADSLYIIKNIFVDPASEGLRQYMKAAGCNEQIYLEAIRAKKSAYLSIRAKSLAVAGQKNQLLRWMRKMEQLYPGLKIPVICFAIGKFEVGGTQFSNTLFIGCEKDLQTGVNIMVQAIHELAHFQQADQNVATNLQLAMIEGGAEFICYQVTRERTIPDPLEYGMAHEKSLWKEFRPALDSSIQMQWFMDTPDHKKNRPGSLAYFMGYRICEAFLKAHRGDPHALQDIIATENPGRIFTESGYQ